MMHSFYTLVITLAVFLNHAQAANLFDDSHIEFLGEASMNTGFTYQNTLVGGLSAISYDVLKKHYYLLSDDGSQYADARFYTASVNLENGKLTNQAVHFSAVTSLRDHQQQPYPPQSIDPEGLAISAQGSMYVSSEGNALQLIPPHIHRVDITTGHSLYSLPMPESVNPSRDQQSGIRHNMALEALTISPDGRFLYAGLENALYQDGPKASLKNKSPARIYKYDLINHQLSDSFLYQTEAVPSPAEPADGLAINGLVELLAVDNRGNLLALERAFSAGVGNVVRLYGVDETGRKALLMNVGNVTGLTIDNLEGMTFGPDLADGRKLLLMVSDNNFNSTQKTQFLAFAVSLPFLSEKHISSLDDLNKHFSGNISNLIMLALFSLALMFRINRMINRSTY